MELQGGADMKLHIGLFSLTITVFAAVLYIVCVAISLIAPSALIAFANQIAHTVDFGVIAKTPTLEGIVTGFISVVIVTAIVSAFFAWLWNVTYGKREVKK